MLTGRAPIDVAGRIQPPRLIPGEVELKSPAQRQLGEQIEES